MKAIRIMIVGVGGQGTLLASRFLGRFFMNRGLDVKVSEVHGMSQRGGSVVTYVSCGERVCSPVIDRGEADYILSFELLEAARWAEYLKEGGLLLSNDQKINPMPVITGAAAYPENIPEKLARAGIRTDIFDAVSPAEKAGSVKAVNIVLLGRFSRYFDAPEEEWLAALDAVVPPNFRELNHKAFRLGRNE